MRTYQVKQKFRLGGERFDIKDELGNVEYQVEGSFLKIPKTFTIYDKNGQEVSHITKRTISFLPKFVVELKDGDRFFIHKKLTLFRDKYDIEDLGLRVQGNIWDLEFKLFDDRDQIVAEISKELFHLTSTYQVSVYEEEYADLVISLCVAIDYVEMLEASAN